VEKEMSNESLPRPKRRRLWSILLMLGIFVCGLVTGGGLTLKIISVRIQDATHNPSEMAERITGRMTRYLDLNDMQSAQVEKIIKQNLADLQPLRTEVRSRLIRQMEKTRREIAPLLTPEQVEKLDKRIRRLQKFWLQQSTE
jgi:Spy/CpxP family protein refolding chaperone